MGLLNSQNFKVAITQLSALLYYLIAHQKLDE